MPKKKATERVFFLLVGIAVQEIFINAFDYVLYPFIIWKFGLLRGGVTMSVLSLFFCYATLIFYGFTKKDWFGIELAKGLREYEGERKILRSVSWILNKGNFISFLFLSLKFDPFTTVVYMRQGADEFPAMDWQSWKIFFVSWLIGNFSWTAVVLAGVSAVEVILKVIN